MWQCPLSGAQSIMMVKSAQPGEGFGVDAHPCSLYLPSQAKLWCTLQLRGQIHYPCFSSTPICILRSKTWIQYFSSFFYFYLAVISVQIKNNQKTRAFIYRDMAGTKQRESGRINIQILSGRLRRALPLTDYKYTETESGFHLPPVPLPLPPDKSFA